MAELLAELKERYSVIIIDSPPVLAVTDAAVLSRHADGVLIVCGATRVRKGELSGSLDALRHVHARVLGVVLNMIPPRGPDADPAVRGYYGYTAVPAPAPRRTRRWFGRRPQERPQD
jgi:non-specific protein-tyrosine kinase